MWYICVPKQNFSFSFSLDTKIPEAKAEIKNKIKKIKDYIGIDKINNIWWK